jgi:hypothetical protein
MHRDKPMKRKKSPGIDQITREIIQQEDKYHVLTSKNLHLCLEYKRIATTCNECIFLLPGRNGLWWTKAFSLSRMHNHTHTHTMSVITPHSVGLLWTSDLPNAETSTLQNTTLTTNIHAPCGIQTHNPSQWPATGTGKDYVTIRHAIKIITN